jgi:hypothetical protein
MYLMYLMFWIAEFQLLISMLRPYLTCARSTAIEHGRPLLPEFSMRAGKVSGHQEAGTGGQWTVDSGQWTSSCCAVERFRWLIHHEGNRGEKLLILATR